MSTYCSDGLHAQNKSIRRKVTGVRKCVFLPQLAEEILSWAHTSMIEGKVAFEEKMDSTSYNTQSVNMLGFLQSLYVLKCLQSPRYLRFENFVVLKDVGNTYISQTTKWPPSRYLADWGVLCLPHTSSQTKWLRREQ